MWRLAFITAFFVLTLLPGAEMITHLAPEVTVDENRVLAKAPSSSTPLDQIARLSDRWFSDHFGFRSLLIRLKTQIDFSVFGMSDRVLVGKDGQLFYRSTVNLEEPAIQELLATDEDPALRGVQDLSRGLNAAGIRLAMVVNLMSDRFYPDLLPYAAIPRPEHPRIDSFIKKLSAIPGLVFLDSTELLRATMPDRRIFHKTDFHWNDPAAFVVGKALVDRMSVEDRRSISPWSHHLVIDRASQSGGIAMFMPLFIPPRETALLVKQTWDWPAGFKFGASQGLFEEATTANPDPKLLPPVVFVGDSFLDGMLRSGLEAEFVETHRIRWRPGLKISDIVSSLPPDTHWVVVQFIEVSQTGIRAFADTADVQKAVQILATRQAR